MFAAALHLFKELPFSDTASAASFGIAKVELFTIRIIPFFKKIYLLSSALIHSRIKCIYTAFSGQILPFFTLFSGLRDRNLEGFEKNPAIFDAETGGAYSIVSR